MLEEWKPVSVNGGIYVGKYEVSNLGRVRASPHNVFQGCRVGRVLKLAPESNGYMQVFLWKGRRASAFKVHRLVAMEFLGDRQEGLHINHRDFDKTNNAVSNLEYVSAQENVWHRVRHDKKVGAIEVFGERLSVPEAIRRFGPPGLSKYTVHTRIKQLGWAAEKAVTTPSARA